jgi:hypothetical protein
LQYLFSFKHAIYRCCLRISFAYSSLPCSHALPPHSLQIPLLHAMLTYTAAYTLHLALPAMLTYTAASALLAILFCLPCSYILLPPHLQYLSLP